jgi:GNAT superfamily N-acetyltransferase/RimJ/RimL family protein N-acetyltransferase
LFRVRNIQDLIKATKDMRTATLKNGESLQIKTVHPSFGEYADRVGDWCWGEIREPLLKGDLKEWLDTPYFVGEIDGVIAGSLGLFTGAEKADVGLVEFVLTDEDHRRKGVASVLLGTLVEYFGDRGGMALYLCTANPHAGMLYEQHGFGYKVGDGMRYLVPGNEDFDATFLAFAGQATVRPANWGDLPQLAVLYNHEEPKWYIKEPLSQCFHQTRFESHFNKLMRRSEDERGCFFVLENPLGRTVGAAILEREDTYYQQHVANLSFRICPSYFSQAGELLRAVANQARSHSIGLLQIHVAASDQDQQEILRAAGYVEEARLRQRLCDDGVLTDLLVYSLVLDLPMTPARAKGEYYGGRHPWQEQRVSNGP